ncbi:Crp/Fnr family transcriptional regulator [Variovorax paradoxus]|uniref:HTH crp-type domain-containing protein n=1 Tax=Variovorax paradoxus TaxID=34073 RepID=A0A679JSC4_VARPD|nr:hypothetical protein VVAX_05424 [Variovorax paradoxus]
MTTASADSDNALVELLPAADRANFIAHCEPVALKLGQVLHTPDSDTAFAYFPTRGFISVVAPLASTPGLEVGMVGNEGMVSAQLILGVGESPFRAVVQGAGDALRISASDLREQLGECPRLKAVLDRYVAVLIRQFATSAICVRYHAIRPRLARWLLMCQDRAHTDSFRMTHEFLAYMLGVRRAGVTQAAGALQAAGTIRYVRGTLTVLDRDGLERTACACYRADRLAFSSLLR